MTRRVLHAVGSYAALVGAATVAAIAAQVGPLGIAILLPMTIAVPAAGYANDVRARRRNGDQP